MDQEISWTGWFPAYCLLSITDYHVNLKETIQTILTSVSL